MLTLPKLMFAGALAFAIPAIGSIATPAMAQGYSDMTCSELWYARNRIYADNGYCFRTPRARRTFGAGCFPPYGRLSGYERESVERIKHWEARNGC